MNSPKRNLFPHFERQSGGNPKTGRRYRPRTPHKQPAMGKKRKDEEDKKGKAPAFTGEEKSRRRSAAENGEDLVDGRRTKSDMVGSGLVC